MKIAMLDALTEWMIYPVYRHAYDNSEVPRAPSSHPALAPYGAHKTKDGQVIFGLQNEREWAVFCNKVLNMPAVATDPRFNSNLQRAAHREEVTKLIEDHFADKTSLEVVALLDEAGIANGRMNTARDVWEHVQFKARDRWRDINTPGGSVKALLPPFTFTDVEAVMGDVPALGADTDAVLSELGFAPDEITNLHQEGAV